ncbi:MAG TPA: carboxypeptidase regulatory-like domain-containing protein [Vicinamibacterales bacterium]|nr:carboxypeptidase regulatory-like domain-containing protein [Vicinamibacterales bacterium]
MRRFQLVITAGLLAFALACGGNTAPQPTVPAGPSVDPSTAGTITATVKFTGVVPPAEMITLTGDPKCVSENGAPQRADERIVVGDGQTLQNVFVYVKDGLGAFGFPIPSEPVVLDQDKCRYTPRVLGVRVGQPLQIRNSDPLLHNVRSNGVINQAFNKSTPLEGVSFNHTFATKEVMVPFKCDVHGWMSAYVGVLDHPYFGTTAPDGRVVLGNLPPGTYTIEAWHELLGASTQQVTIGAKEAKDVSFTFAR